MKIILALGVVLLVTALMWALRSRQQASTTADGQVIEQLAKAGSDLSKPHSIEFFLYFPTEEAAQAAVSDLNDPSFVAAISRAEKGPEWLLQLTRSMRPVEADLVKLRGSLEDIAGKRGGVYDGWGSPIESGA